MRSRWLLLATDLYALAIAAIGLWKTPVDRGVPVADLATVRWMAQLLDLQPYQAYDVTESAANVVLFVPLGVLVLLWRPTWGWLHGVGIALVTTVTIETTQQVLRPERFASIDDVLANTAGGAIGALLVLAGRRLRPTHDLSVADGAVADEPVAEGSGDDGSDGGLLGDDRRG